MNHLNEHPFCHHLTSEELEAVQRISEPVAFEPGEYLLRVASQAEHVYLIGSGHVALELGGHILQTLGPGDFVGLSWLEPPYRWKFDCRAVEPTRTVRLDAQALRSLMTRDPALSNSILRQVVRTLFTRLESARLRLLDLYR